MKRTSLARAIALLALCVGFYVVALAIVAALFWLPWAQSKYEHGPGLTGLLCGALGCWLLYALIPRRARIVEPGEPLRADEHPQLQALVREVAARVGEKAPDQLYLVPEATAFTNNRSRYFGLVKRRLVGIGLPLLQVLSRDELAAVIAHELGHHHGGDVGILPWLAETRRALARTLEELDESILGLHLPFVWYTRMFLRLTLQLSREQELYADALAAKVVGAGHMASALRKTHEVGPRWTVYWEQEVVPVLSANRRPALLEGFALFRQEAAAQPELTRAFEKARERTTSPYDTHPSLQERLAALSDQGLEGDQTGSAWQLLDAAHDVELRALGAVIPIDAVRALEPLAWNDAAKLLWLPGWQKALAPHREALASLSIETAAHVVGRDRAQYAARLRPGLALLSPEAEARRLASLMGAWLALELVETHGYRVDTAPGSPIRLVRGDHSLEPLKVMRELSEGAISADSYAQLCRTVRERATADERA